MGDAGWRIGFAGVAALAFVAGIVLLIVQVRSLLNFLRNRVVAELPFAGMADLALDQAGSFVLGIDRPRLSGWNQPTGSVLADKATGRDRYRYWLVAPGAATRVEGSKTLVPFTTTTMSRIRCDVARFEVPHAGTWRLTVDGFVAGADDREIRWRMARASNPLAFPARILGLVAAGALAIVGLVFTLLSFAA